jgi:hypothetical protein
MRSASLWIGLLVPLGFLTNPAFCKGQEQTRDPSRSALEQISGGGRITGIVIDSLHDRPLVTAEVLAEGKAVAVAHTDSSGSFNINGLPAGKYRITVSHPWLDTLGISLITPDFFVVTDSVTFVRVAVPGTSTLIGLKCRKPSPAGSASAIIGHVTSAESLKPIPNVEVAVNWTIYEVSAAAGVKTTTHVERDTTGLSGAYKICGLPNGLEANVEARVAGELRSEFRIAIPDSGITLVVRNLNLPAAGPDSGRTATISGRVQFPDDQPGRGSSVEVIGTGRKAIANERGEFTLDKVPVGTQTVTVRQLGYEEVSVVMNVAPSMGGAIVISLKKTVPKLAPVTVSATERAQTLDHVGFSQRSQHSVGHFLTAEQIKHMSDFQFTDLLRGIPGLTVGIDKYGQDVVFSRRAGGSQLNPTYGCVQYFVDGLPWGNGALEAIRGGRPQDSAANKILANIAIEAARQLNTVLKKSEILGIEVYQGGGAPAYFNQGGHNCATIVIWTTASVS